MRKKNNINNVERVAVGLSGGVDSSVAAFLLKEQGYEVVGVYMQCWDSKADGCRADEDRADAVRVASHLGIKFEFLDFVDAYKSRVIDFFYREYERGLTPNPDIACNKEIKFGLFLNWAQKQGFDYIATGHYARVSAFEGEKYLYSGVDEKKDQSYFLYTLTAEQLLKVIFPLGELYKTRVRGIASDLGLHTHDKPDSVGICFIGEVNIENFLSRRIKSTVGNVKNSFGEIIGSHIGVPFYTIGQRHGFSVKSYHSAPLYVLSKNHRKNEIVVGTREECYFDKFFIKNTVWTHKQPSKNAEYSIRIRHLGKFYSCTLSKEANSLWHVALREPVFGVAPGQSAVVYAGDRVLGGGVIATEL